MVNIFFKKTSAEIPDFNFDYNDSDTLDAELAEWYTYSEEPEFVWNLNAFKSLFTKKCKSFFGKLS